MKQLILTGAAALAMVLGTGAAQADKGISGGGGGGPVITCDPDAGDECDTPPVSGDDGTGTGGTGSGGGGTTTGGSGGGTTSNFASGITTYSIRSAYDAAVGSATTDGFEGIATPTSGGIGVMQYQSGSYTDVNGTTFGAPTTGSVINLNILDSSYLNGSNTVGQKFGSDVLTSNYSTLTITFGQAVNSFGIDFAAQGRGFVNQSDSFTFAIGGLGSQTFTSNATGLTFLGLSSDTAFNSITITGSGNSNMFFDNASFTPAATSSDVPEPASWAMMVGGFGLLGGALRRRKSQVTFA